MAKKSSWNPLAFVPAQVTVWTSAIYIALIAVLLWVHLSVPPAPGDQLPTNGVNLTQAWLDLDFITDGFHPIGSRRNEVVREYLLQRIGLILEGNGVDYDVDHPVGKNSTQATAKKRKGGKEDDGREAKVFVDDISNVTFTDDWRAGSSYSTYIEGNNILVYIKGKQDEGKPWQTGQKYTGPGGVLVNAHVDSVSTGYGATDDGVGVVTVLQLISYFTTEGRQPDHGIVALLNNGEENGLYGAHAYLQHPLSQFTHTFLNLEGAGAGGRATLFRSTDAEVTRFYAQSPYPFGSAISGDGFKQGFIRSGTDYSVFAGKLGMRGLDVAFFEPRARYHTNQDSARETSPDSLWHMLSSSIATMEGLTSYNGDDFEGSTTRSGKLDLKKGSTGVWFDLFGRAFAVMQLNVLFALSVTLLVAGPVLLILLEFIISRSDKWYPLTRKSYLYSSDDDDPVQLHGFRGFFRWPIAFVVATAAVVALGFLVTKINPFIVYGSEHVVWAMMLTAWFSVSWFILAGGDRIRPTALQRMFCLIWLYVLTWLLLVLATVGENNFKLASGYFIVIYNASVFVALLISYLELFGLPTKRKYVEHVLGATVDHDNASTRPGSRSSRTLLNQSRERPAAEASGDAEHEDADEATESTSLLRGSGQRSGQGTFTNFAKRQQHPDEELEDSGDPLLAKPYGGEQAWSSSLPQWTWILQFIVLAPINIILIGQIGLLLTSALHQTLSDGNPALPVYIILGALAVLLMLPTTPFLHRFTYQIPTLLFLIFIGCLVYSLTAFPFSRDARMKFYFAQTIDLESGKNNVSLMGLDGYIQDIIAELPSAAGQEVHCGDGSMAAGSGKVGLQTCSWSGLAPRVGPVHDEAAVAPYSNKTKKSHSYDDWVHYKVSINDPDTGSASFTLSGVNTKECALRFENPISSVFVEGSGTNTLLPTIGEEGSSSIRLLSRSYDKVFNVNVTWDDGQKATGQKGKVVCLWDESEGGKIPALDEVMRFAPVWSTATKAGDGLVEGWKEFEL